MVWVFGGGVWHGPFPPDCANSSCSPPLVVETHPDDPLPDLRLLHPFEGLTSFCDSIDLEVGLFPFHFYTHVQDSDTECAPGPPNSTAVFLVRVCGCAGG